MQRPRGAPAVPPGSTEMIRIWITIAATASHGRRSCRSASAVRRPRASGTLARTEKEDESEDHAQPASARGDEGSLQQMSNCSLRVLHRRCVDWNRAPNGGAVTRRSPGMKARLYRTALSVEHRRRLPRGARRGLEVGLGLTSYPKRPHVITRHGGNNHEGPQRPQVVGRGCREPRKAATRAGHPLISVTRPMRFPPLQTPTAPALCRRRHRSPAPCAGVGVFVLDGTSAHAAGISRDRALRGLRADRRVRPAEGLHARRRGRGHDLDHVRVRRACSPPAPRRAFVALVGANFVADAMRGKAPKSCSSTLPVRDHGRRRRAWRCTPHRRPARGRRASTSRRSDLPGILAAAAVFFVVNSALVATVIALVQRSRIGRYLVQRLLLPGLDRRPDARPRADGRARRRLRAAGDRAAVPAAARRAPRRPRGDRQGAPGAARRAHRPAEPRAVPATASSRRSTPAAAPIASPP